MEFFCGFVALHDYLAAIHILDRYIALPVYEVQSISSGTPAIDLVVAGRAASTTFQRIIDRDCFMTHMIKAQEARAYVQRFFTPANAQSYDLVARYATFGQDHAWKLRIVDLVGTKSSVLELACGTGVLTFMLTSAGKNVTGLDLTFDYLVASRRKTNNNDSALIQATAEVLPHKDSQFDAVVSSYLAKYTDVRLVAQECYRVLRPGGVVIFHDFTRPSGRLIRSLWNSYLRILGLVGLFLPSWRAVFDELGTVIGRSNWERTTLAALKETGFNNATLTYYTGGTAAIVSAERP